MLWLCRKQKGWGEPQTCPLSSCLAAAVLAAEGLGCLLSGQVDPFSAGAGCLCPFFLQSGTGGQDRGGSDQVVPAASPAAAAAAAWLPSFAWRGPQACFTCGARAGGMWAVPTVRIALCGALFLPGGRFGLPSQLLWRVPSHKVDAIGLFF